MFEADAEVLSKFCEKVLDVSKCESASNLDPTPIVHQIVEAEAELLISGVFDRRPTVTPSFSRKSFDCNAL